MCSYIIRKIDDREIDSIYSLEKKCFEGPKAYKKSQLTYLVKKAKSTCLVACNDKDILGFIIVTYRKNSKTANIETIDVDPDYQNLGIGSALLDNAEIEMRKQDIKRSQLEVSERNENALWIYKKAGYKVNKFLVGYYYYDNLGSRNAIRMIKAFS